MEYSIHRYFYAYATLHKIHLYNRSKKNRLEARLQVYEACFNAFDELCKYMYTAVKKHHFLDVQLDLIIFWENSEKDVQSDLIYHSIE